MIKIFLIHQGILFVIGGALSFGYCHYANRGKIKLRYLPFLTPKVECSFFLLCIGLALCAFVPALAMGWMAVWYPLSAYPAIKSLSGHRPALLRCPYCHEKFSESNKTAVVSCWACAIKLHADCWGLNGCCPTPGCNDTRFLIPSP